MEPRTLLIVTDSSADRAPFLEQLSSDVQPQFRMLEAGTLKEARAMLQSTVPDCVILEELLPDGKGLEFLLGVADQQGRLPFPVVVLTNAGDRETAVAVMKAGAQDYLVRSQSTATSIRSAVTSAADRGRAERRIEEQRHELERLYEEARANNDALRAANGAKDDFLAMLSHELRTPLTPVLSLVSSMMGDKALSADLRETFSLIQRNVELEARLIDDLLDLTQIASGRLRIERTPVDLHSCLEAALDVCHESFAEKRITVRTEMAAPHSMILGEFARLNQVFWNILKNAVKFTKPGGHVTIVTSNDGPNIVTEIRDDGMGIPPERLTSVFGAFNPIKPQPTATGIGLGLAITRAIVEGHDGEIHAESDGTGCGAVFRIRLPNCEAVKEPSATLATASSSAAVRGKTILVVEDHEDTRRVLSRALRRKGFGVTAAGSVEGACEQFAALPTDLIICDIGLPDGTGWDLMEKLRPHGPVRAIAVSGYGMDHDVNRSREVGFIDHLTKPIDFPRLESLIVQTLKE